MIREEFYKGQLFCMRTAVKKKLLILLGDNPATWSLYYAHQEVIRIAIIKACDQFEKPTRRTDVIDKIAYDIYKELMGSQKFFC